MSLGSRTVKHPETPLHVSECLTSQEELPHRGAGLTLHTQWPHSDYTVTSQCPGCPGWFLHNGKYLINRRFLCDRVDWKLKSRLKTPQGYVHNNFTRSCYDTGTWRWPHEHTWCFTLVMEYYSPLKRTWRNLKHAGEVKPGWKGVTVYDWNMTL